MTSFIAGDNPETLALTIRIRSLSNNNAASSIVDFISHLSSSIWRSVAISFDLDHLYANSGIMTPRTLDRLDGHQQYLPLTTEDLITSWSLIDQALSHRSYDNVTKVLVSCNIHEVEVLPPGFKCPKDLFAKLLPRQKARERLDVRCHPESPDENIVCAYHK